MTNKDISVPRERKLAQIVPVFPGSGAGDVQSVTDGLPRHGLTDAALLDGLGNPELDRLSSGPQLAESLERIGAPLGVIQRGHSALPVAVAVARQVWPGRHRDHAGAELMPRYRQLQVAISGAVLDLVHLLPPRQVYHTRAMMSSPPDTGDSK